MNVLPKQRQIRRICSPKCKWVSASPISVWWPMGAYHVHWSKQTSIYRGTHHDMAGRGSVPNHTHIDSPYMALVYTVKPAATTSGGPHRRLAHKTGQANPTEPMGDQPLRSARRTRRQPGRLPITTWRTSLSTGKKHRRRTTPHHRWTVMKQLAHKGKMPSAPCLSGDVLSLPHSTQGLRKANTAEVRVSQRQRSRRTSVNSRIDQMP